MAEADRANFRPRFSGDTETALKRRHTEIQARWWSALVLRRIQPKAPFCGFSSKFRLSKLRVSADKTRQEKIKVIQTRTSAIAMETQRIQAEIQNIEGPERARLSAIRQERKRAYGAYFQNLKKEQQTLEELYEPIRARLDSASEQEQDLQFSIRWDESRQWLERGSVLFDQGRRSPTAQWSSWLRPPGAF